MAACATIPIQTSVIEQVGQQVLQTQVPFTSTLPPTFVTSTISTLICSTNTTSPTSSVCNPTFATSVETITGGTTVFTITTGVTNPVTTSITTTLFTTSCTTTPGEVSTPIPITTTPVSEPSSTTTSIGTNTSAVTLPNGSVSTQTTTFTSTGLPPPTPTTQDNTLDKGSKTNVAAIAGGAAGGVVGLLALALVAWYFFKKSSNLDNLFNSTGDFEKTNRLGPLDDNANGYQYGLLGNEGNVTGPAPPPEASIGGGQVAGYQSSGNETGYQPGHFNDVGAYQPTGNETGYQPDALHYRNSSLAPLLSGLGAAAGAAAGAVAGGAAHAVANSRPSTGGSTHPLISPNQQQGCPPHGYTYPPNSASGPGQGYGGAQGQCYAPNQGYYNSEQSHGYGSVQGHTLNPSSGSSPYNPQPQIAAIGGASAGYSQDSDLDDRSGSPVSIQEQRVLQVINPDTSYRFSSHGGGGELAAAGSSSSSAPVPLPALDGKGRPISLAGQMVPLVHLDGGRYEEPLPASGGGFPPAYSNS